MNPALKILRVLRHMSEDDSLGDLYSIDRVSGTPLDQAIFEWVDAGYPGLVPDGSIRWELCTAKENSLRLPVLLSQGWEPLHVVSAEDPSDEGPAVYHLRRRVFSPEK